MEWWLVLIEQGWSMSFSNYMSNEARAQSALPIRIRCSATVGQIELNIHLIINQLFIYTFFHDSSFFTLP